MLELTLDHLVRGYRVYAVHANFVYKVVVCTCGRGAAGELLAGCRVLPEAALLSFFGDQLDPVIGWASVASAVSRSRTIRPKDSRG